MYSSSISRMGEVVRKSGCQRDKDLRRRMKK